MLLTSALIIHVALEESVRTGPAYAQRDCKGQHVLKVSYIGAIYTRKNKTRLT